MEKLRIDKWLWAARFYKTRSLAADELDKGRVRINDTAAKPAREVKVGDEVQLRQGQTVTCLVVRGISSQRSGAPLARLLYEETAESVAAKTMMAQQRHLEPEPASSQGHGRPTTRERRDLDKAGSKSGQADWDSRWSASMR